MALYKVISGGQTGVDIAALRAAARAQLRTGGTMPKGFRTSAGPRPEWAVRFGLRQSPRADYAARTEVNVIDADATLIVCAAAPSAGVLCTQRAVFRHGRPRLEVPLVWTSSHGWTWELGEQGGSIVARRAAKWIRSAQVRTLNVAGHSERTAPDIEAFIEPWLYEVFRRVQAITPSGESECG